ncbi:MAG TPA: tyrosine-type recombinase/integrase [Candidatus Limnocylindrales bacterium]|nr:tyrosine-type recombinase/integrase [Candidatus Limnocylindrales bacterium]
MIYKRKGHWHLDVTMHGVRYREALETTDKRVAKELEKKRIAEIDQGKGASKTGRAFARKPFSEAVAAYLEERKPHVAERTMQFETERLKPLTKHFGEKPLLRFKAEDLAGYQTARLHAGVSGRTVNMETGVLRRMLKRAKVWNAISEDVKALPERQGAVGKVLPSDLKRMLFDTAASKPEWIVAHCAAVLAVSTTCRGVEVRNLRWQDVDLFSRVATIRRSKTAAGHRTIPLNGDAMASLARLLERAQAHDCSEPSHYVFPTCEHLTFNPLRPQKSWRTAWRKLVAETARRAGRNAAREALNSGYGLRATIAVWKRAASPLKGLRFHDLRHQAITELAEGGASDATMMAVAGHMSRRMLEHYSHVRMTAKRTALDKLECGLMGGLAVENQPAVEKVN